MISKKENFILAKKLVVYNNFAEIDDLVGRLLVELQIYPIPRILWDFEILGMEVPQFHDVFASESLLENFFLGYLIQVERLKLEVIIRGVDISSTAKGTALRAYLDLDDPETQSHKFNFCLTNTRFQRIYHCHVLDEDCDGGVVKGIPLNSKWAINLEIGKQACKWLDTRKDNVGIYLTGVGTLFQLKETEEAEKIPESLTNITISEAEAILKNLCLLLSYANGGFIAPVFIEGEKYNKYEPDENDLKSQAFIATETTSTLISTAYQFTSLEKLGKSWLTEDSDLEVFISCFGSFEKMLAKTFWKETFYFILVQYFQAITSNNWQLAASATGAALERLSYAILVEDENETIKKEHYSRLFEARKTPLKQKIKLLLERIGLTTSRGYDDVTDVEKFTSVRNDSVHPKVSKRTLEDRSRAIMQAIQWIDDVLLWRLGYEGHYIDRVTGSFPTLDNPNLNLRYDLSLRDSSW
jgi:hypothetical protein